jgi:hypothetical protein
VTLQVPVQFGEMGQHYDGNDCGSSNVDAIMNWADANGVGYQAWQWNPWGTCLDLITEFDGTVANSNYARAVKAHYLTRP